MGLFLQIRILACDPINGDGALEGRHTMMLAHFLEGRISRTPAHPAGGVQGTQYCDGPEASAATQL